jgi:hypothetical protein
MGENKVNIKPSQRALKRWIEDTVSTEPESIFDFDCFRNYKEVKDLDLVDQKALWDKLSQNFFKILLSVGEFNFKDLGIIRLIYRFSEENNQLSLELCPIINDSGCKQSLTKYTSIIKINDEKQLEKELLE